MTKKLKEDWDMDCSIAGSGAPQRVQLEVPKGV